MVGNDIVDIKEAKRSSNWERPRFLDKLFTPMEQLIIHNQSNAFIAVWRLWSMKEAAYKLYTRLYPSRFYNPMGFECEVNLNSGIVRYQTFECFVETRITSNYILSEARLHETKMTSKVILFDNNKRHIQRKLMRNLVLKTTASNYNVSAKKLRVTKSDFGIPSVNLMSKELPLSLTYHGVYGAYVTC